MRRPSWKAQLLLSTFVAVILWAHENMASAFVIADSGRNTVSLHGWSRFAEMDANGTVICSSCQGDDATTASRNNDHYDLTSPREWLESCEAKDGQGGAYTVMRCDYDSSGWKLWGPDFHWSRLRQSFCTLQSVNEEQLQGATTMTNVILDALLQEAILLLKDPDVDSTYTAMVTFLWQRGTDRILVRGHACCSGEPSRLVEYDPEPAVAVLALSSNHEKLPNRCTNHPEAKLSAWCRQRRPLEEMFGPQVLLTKRVGDDIRILEGLTANIFVVYPNDTIRTENVGVLKGYARKLVLDCAKACGLRYDPSPILLRDAHLWREVFLTSSIRLVVPVKTTSVPDKQEGTTRVIWSYKNDSHKWRLLYQRILQHDGSFITRNRSTPR